MGSDEEGDPDRKPGDRQGRVSIPLPFEEAMRALLKVDPATVPAGPENGSGKPAKPRAKKQTKR
jgi:hypothetical protein